VLRQLRSSVEGWPLASPFRISRGVKTLAEVVTVELRQEDVRGLGEAVPYPRYDETAEAVTEQIRSVERDLANGAGRSDLVSLLPSGAARNAIDCALWDLECRLSGKALADTLWGERLRPLTTALTVSLDAPERMREAAATLRDCRLIKVKVDAAEPEACLRAVRDSVPGAEMIVDPNESWDIALLERLQPLLRELRTTFVEQPLAAGADEALDGFQPLVPICADESCHTVADLDRLAGRYGMINIKLDKTGGLTEALALMEEGRQRGFGIMVGCMVSTSLSIAPAFHLAGRADYADIDGPLWLREDRAGGVRLQGGLLSPPEPGFWGSPPPASR
jgi:L-alanine-DL-glutamate epimerase-like enolase superfamily enzyme